MLELVHWSIHTQCPLSARHEEMVGTPGSREISRAKAVWVATDFESGLVCAAHLVGLSHLQVSKLRPQPAKGRF